MEQAQMEIPQMSKPKLAKYFESIYDSYKKNQTSPLFYQDFVEKWLLLTKNNYEASKNGNRDASKWISKNKVYMREYPCEVKVIEEPINLIELFANAKTKPDKLKVFSDIVLPEHTRTLKFDEPFENNIWFNSTEKGINLRYGFRDGNSNNPNPSVFGDGGQVHGKMGGTTGSGKSVTINHLLMTLMLEFAPWELDIRLADFKIVELLRYGTDEETISRHIRNIAATEDISYVKTALAHIEAMMVARQELFGMVGLQNIQDFRKIYGVCLPRIIYLVDEFQQLFLLATTKENSEISTMFERIAKLGRATGVHMLLTSQTLSNSLSADILSQFKLSAALSCDATTSTSLIGNDGASLLRGKGKVYVNTTGAKEDNVLYRVPFINGDIPNLFGKKKDEHIEKCRRFFKDGDIFDSDKNIRSEFYMFLHFLKRMGDKAGYEVNLKIYQEKLLPDTNDFLDSTKESFLQTAEMKKEDQLISESWVLGQTTEYKTKKTEWEYIFLEKADWENILFVSKDNKILAEFMKLAALNLVPKKDVRLWLSCTNDVLYKMYDPRDELKFEDDFKSSFPMDIMDVYKTRRLLMTYDGDGNLLDFYDHYCRVNNKEDGFIALTVLELLKGIDFGEWTLYRKADFIEDLEKHAPEAFKEFNKFKTNDEEIDLCMDLLRNYDTLRGAEMKDGKPSFATIFVWCIGIDKMDNLLKGVPHNKTGLWEEMFKLSAYYGIHFLIFTTSITPEIKGYVKQTTHVIFKTEDDNDLTAIGTEKLKSESSLVYRYFYKKDAKGFKMKRTTIKLNKVIDRSLNL